MKKELPIVAPEGYEIDRERMVFVPKEIDLFPDDKDFCATFEWKYHNHEIHFSNKKFRDKILAFTKLIELRDEVNRRDGFVVDWTNGCQEKRCIEYSSRTQYVDSHRNSQRPFAFRTFEIAKQFAEKYKHLIDQCSDLI